MTAKEQGPKLFTVEEANQLIPQVRDFLRQLRKERDEIDKLEEKKAVEELSWLQPDGTVSPKAQMAVSQMEKSLEEATRSFKELLGQLDALGAQLKDLEEGLIDFFAARREELVYLCWKEGEDRIRFWHDLKSGFSGRRPLEQL